MISVLFMHVLSDGSRIFVIKNLKLNFFIQKMLYSLFLYDKFMMCTLRDVAD